MKILQVGLDRNTLTYLVENGFVIEETGAISDIEELESWITSGSYEAVVIDLYVSGLGAFVARHFRKRKMNIPIIGISPSVDRPWPEERAIFLENGGDDLIRGPANPRELCASLRAVTRRFVGAVQSVVEFTHEDIRLKFNHATRSIQLNGREPELTGTEREMLFCLAARPGRVRSKEELLEELYALRPDNPPDIKIIDVFICKIRKKFALTARSDEAEKLIETVWGRGYRLKSSSDTLPRVA